MSDSPPLDSLHAEHTRDAIARRLNAATRHSYLKDFVYGGIDGAVTTFAVVSGVAGAGLSSGVVIVLGAANLIGDGFSMAASNYLGCRAEQQQLRMARATEEQHIHAFPEGEREEVRQIMQSKGFSGDSLESAVKTITSDKTVWVDTMLREEYGLALERPDPVRAALVTFLAFLAIGVLPLTVFIADYLVGGLAISPFPLSTALTGIAFFAVGAVKARFVLERWYWSGFETLFVGGIAALLAYLAGMLLSGVVPPGATH